MSTINTIIRGRRSVYPPQYIDKPISKEIIHELLLNANQAPTHKLTEPWRFKIFLGEGKNALGKFLAKKYVEITPEYEDRKVEKTRNNPKIAGAVLAIIVNRDPEQRIPEWEEIASVAMAVQNIWVALDQYGLGGYWSSPPLINHLHEHVSMKENERCLGFFYIGHCEPTDRIKPRKPIEDKIEWIE